MDINIVTVSGIVDKTPTSSKTTGVLYVNFSLAVTHANNTHYYAISASGKNAENILNSVNVGDKLFIIGKPSIDTYMGKDKQVIGIQKVWIDKFESCNSKTPNFMDNTSNVEPLNEVIDTPVNNEIDDFKTEQIF